MIAVEAKELASQKEKYANQQWEFAQNSLARESQKTLELQRQLYISDMIAAHEAIKGNNIRRAVKLLLPYGPGAERSECRRWEWGLLWEKKLESSNVGPVAPLMKNVTTFDVTRNGVLAAGKLDGLVELYDLRLNKSVVDFKSQETAVTLIACQETDDSLRLVTGNDDGDLSFWRQRRHGVPQVEEKLKGVRARFSGQRNDNANIARISGDGTILACGGNDNALYLFDLNTNELKRRLEGHRDEILDIAFSKNGDRIATASFDNTVRIWSLDDTSGTASNVLAGHSASVRGVLFLDDGATLVSGAGDRTIKFWDIEAGRERLTLPAAHIVAGLALASENQLISYSGGPKDNLHIWQRPSLEEVNATGHSVDAYLNAGKQ